MTEFLGREIERTGRAIYLALEEKLSEVTAHFDLLGVSDSDRISVLTGGIDRGQALERLEATLQQYPDVVLVVIDPLFKFLDGVRNTDDYMQITNALTRLLDLARTYKVHIMVVHHMKKRTSENVMDGLLGSTAIFGNVDTSIALTRQPNGVRSIATRQRYGIELPETQLTWNADQRSMSLGVSADQAHANEATETERRIGDEIVEYVAANDGSTLEQVMAAVTGKRTTKMRVFNAVSKQFFERSGDGIKGDPYLYRISEAGIRLDGAEKAESLGGLL